MDILQLHLFMPGDQHLDTIYNIFIRTFFLKEFSDNPCTLFFVIPKEFNMIKPDLRCSLFLIPTLLPECPLDIMGNPRDQQGFIRIGP